MISYNLKNKKSQPRRQDVTRLFFCDGSLYVSCAASFKKYKSFFHKKTLGKIMPKWKSLEIDDYIDYSYLNKLTNEKTENLLNDDTLTKNNQQNEINKMISLRNNQINNIFFNKDNNKSSNNTNNVRRSNLN